ncbi:MAG: FMN-binding protein [Spirochaetales bacterium]|nr:FMN-binding protein [Spirochaetales bacterium]
MKKIILILLIIFVAVSAISAIGPKKAGHHGSAQYSIPEGFDISTMNIPDGIYEGVATGFSPELKVEIVVTKGDIVSVKVTDHNEVGPKYYSTPIKYIPLLIVKEQNTVVDVVSGATATSKAIMAAVENAIKNALL